MILQVFLVDLQLTETSHLVFAVGTFKLANGQKTWCVAKPSSSAATLLENINYACSQVDCRILQKGCPCSSPDNLINRASIAMNLYYQCKGRNKWNCDFKHSGLITVTDPSVALYNKVRMKKTCSKTDWTSNQEDDDIESGRYGEITTAIRRDDAWGLISCLRRCSASYPEDEILESICLYDAVNCAASLLRGELNSDQALLDLNAPMPGAGPFFPLHYAADFACPRVRPLVGADSILSGTFYISVDSIPLSSRNGLFSFPATTDCPKESALKACKFLAWSSKNVEKEVSYYAIEGKLTEFAILLMVARKKVLVPITFSIQDGDDWDRFMMLRQCLREILESISDEWLKSPGTLGRKKATWILKSNVVLRSAALVLEVVERAGNSLEDYLMFEQHSASKEQVERDVASRLEKAGFTLEARDFEVSIRTG
ncbi:hypothetical protein RHMOL_Rhmol04G0054600 [Rhododendron molle]|uniref:Uncharacterized protein n=1 Tax=Rhododendron molle TaxID=49168 RepID=A0ACC0NZI5_RHOML|nr:hypothetical protein RHMOL_Rhmol04G0054600 [Rhododendron molle]